MLRRTRCLVCAAFILPPLLSTSCATGHVLNWGQGEPSVFRQPGEGIPPAYAHTLGTILAFPAAVAFDVATFPLQLVWGYYPYGSTLTPEEQDS